MKNIGKTYKTIKVKNSVFLKLNVFLLCILMIDNNFNSIYYIVSYRTNISDAERMWDGNVRQQDRGYT